MSDPTKLGSGYMKYAEKQIDLALKIANDAGSKTLISQKALESRMQTYQLDFDLMQLSVKCNMNQFVEKPA